MNFWSSPSSLFSVPFLLKRVTFLGLHGPFFMSVKQFISYSPSRDNKYSVVEISTCKLINMLAYLCIVEIILAVKFCRKQSLKMKTNKIMDWNVLFFLRQKSNFIEWAFHCCKISSILSFVFKVSNLDMKFCSIFGFCFLKLINYENDLKKSPL